MSAAGEGRHKKGLLLREIVSQVNCGLFVLALWQELFVLQVHGSAVCKLVFNLFKFSLGCDCLFA